MNAEIKQTLLYSFFSFGGAFVCIQRIDKKKDQLKTLLSQDSIGTWVGLPVIWLRMDILTYNFHMTKNTQIVWEDFTDFMRVFTNKSLLKTLYWFLPLHDIVTRKLQVREIIPHFIYGLPFPFSVSPSQT